MTNEDQQRLMQYAKAHGVSAIGSYGKGGLPTVLISGTETADYEWAKALVDREVCGCDHAMPWFSGWEFIALEISMAERVKCTLCGAEVLREGASCL